MRVLVHGGGGSNGDWGVGVIRHLLLTEGRKYDAYVGISTGALSMACLAQYTDDEAEDAVEHLESVYDGIRDNSDVYRKWKPAWLWPLMCFLPPFFKKWRKPSLYDATPLHHLVERNLERPWRKEFVVGAVRVGGAEGYETFNHNNVYIDEAILASSAYPVFFQPVQVGQYWYSDGGLRNVVPLKDAVKLGATDIDVICTSPAVRTPSRLNPENANVLDSALDASGVLVDQVTLDSLLLRDFQTATERNYNKKYRRINLRLYQPSRDLGDSLAFGADKHPSHIANMVLGLSDATKGPVLQEVFL